MHRLKQVFFFQLADSDHNLRGHSPKLFKPRCQLSSSLHIYTSQRSIDMWNALPQAVITATSVNNFMSRLDEFWGVQMRAINNINAKIRKVNNILSRSSNVL